MDPHSGPTREQLQYTYNLLQRLKDHVLILDTRSLEEFESMHLANSISLARLTDIDTPLTIAQIESLLPDKASCQQFSKRKRLCTLICHSEVSEPLAQSVYRLLQADKCKELHLLAAPMDQFLGIYRFLSSGLRVTPLRNAKVGYPNEIIPNQLFLGNQHHAESPEVMEHLGITHIVNATKTVHNKFPDKIQYCRIVVEDSDKEMICYHFNIAFRFMDYALLENEDRSQHRVLVHCAQGVSRSATIVIMYLMKKFDWSFEEAYEYAKRHRNEVQPNDGFQEQLREFADARTRFKQAQMMRKRLKALPAPPVENGTTAS